MCIDQYVEDYNLLTGPIDNINVLYMSKNKLTKIPIDKISQSVHMREIWLDSNEISDLNFTEDTPIMEECEFINLRLVFLQDFSHSRNLENTQLKVSSVVSLFIFKLKQSIATYRIYEFTIHQYGI